MANSETSEKANLLVVKASSGVKGHLVQLLRKMEGVEIISIEEMEDLLFGEILCHSQRGDYVDEEEVNRAFHEAQV